MTNYKAIIERDGCETGCGRSKICMCALAEDMADEIERLREALGKVSRMKVFPDPQINQFTLATAIQIASAALEEGEE
jgi:hypothetical protein